MITSCILFALPPELLGEIFTHAARKDPDAPLVLGAVCTAFRRIGHTTPGAWTSLRLMLHGNDALCVRKAAHFFRMAGACFIHVDVDMHTNHRLGDLLCLLHAHRMRIRALALRTQTVNDAAQFFGGVYPPVEPEEDVPLERLALRSTSDGPIEPPAHLRHRVDPPPAPFVSLAHRSFPRLAHLSIASQPLPALLHPLDNAGHLRELRIVYPLRFAPLSLPDLFQLLHAMPLLETLHVDARVALDSAHGTAASSSTTTTTITSHTLVPLPRLAYLSLRINNVPTVLAHLLLPALTTLRIDDLDGKRPRAALQTAAALRMLLVRMELPLPGVVEVAPRGLRMLDLCGVTLAAPFPAPANAHPSATSSPGQQGSDLGDLTSRAPPEPEEDAAALWAWCARRMRTLRELSVRRVDQHALWRLVTPPVPVPVPGSTGAISTIPGAPRDDEDMLPALRRLVVIDSSSGGGRPAPGERSASLFHVNKHVEEAPSSFSSLHDDAELLTPARRCSDAAYECVLPLAVRTFQQRRPEVVVEYSCLRDAGWDSASVGIIDFLDLYTRQ